LLPSKANAEGIVTLEPYIQDNGNFQKIT
jgi:hypothetical protein